MRATFAVIHLDALQSNIAALRARFARANKNPAICLPVKADAYGHGAREVAASALRAGVRCLAVATVDEGVYLREGGIGAPVLVLSQGMPAEFEALCAYRLSPLAGDLEAARLLAECAGRAAGERLPVFVKIDTGMGRGGCRPKDAAELAACVAGAGSLEYAGALTHFAAADSFLPEDRAYTRRQIALFDQALQAIGARGVCGGIVSAANSGAALWYPEAWFDMVRPGIALYGYPPQPGEDAAPAVDGGAAGGFRPLMELRTHVVAIKTVYKGESVSYGRTWTAAADTRIAVLPVGYGDGLPRALSGNFLVVIRGRRYP
ncbi:MAG: alanine racemase, partial [Spirochaetaceae bacterium]|nr:alanine racemase [Spirochaetaceae bacterium]